MLNKPYLEFELELNLHWGAEREHNQGSSNGVQSGECDRECDGKLNWSVIRETEM